MTDLATANAWRAKAACLGTPVEIFFWSSNINPLARELCRSCPVAAECLEATIEAEAQTWQDLGRLYGFFGGMTVTKRTPLVRARAKRYHLTPRATKCNHPERKNAALGMCKQCYYEYDHKRNPRRLPKKRTGNVWV